jgi:indolepyruvate ferredoxin oxidoreductase beta subunit
MESFDIYMAGVGGQGIGLLAEALARAADAAGHVVHGCDTHGLAQRGGSVSSNLRLGPGPRSPLVSAGRADLVIGMERHEALRAALAYLRPGGTLLWYDVSWEPLPVRLGKAAAVGSSEIEAACAREGWIPVRVFREGLPDARTQNVVILGVLAEKGIIPRLGRAEYAAALEELMEGTALRASLALLGQAG